MAASTWQPGALRPEPQPGTWRLWEADVTIPSAGDQRLRARDRYGRNTQPERASPNPAGYGNNSIHEVRVHGRSLTPARALCSTGSDRIALLATAVSAGCRTAGVDAR